MERVTIKDVAEKSGYSMTTISQILNGKDHRFSKKAIKEVKATARKLGYVPDFFASNMAKQQSNVIAVVVPDLGNQFFIDLVRGIEKITNKYGFLTIVLDGNNNQDSGHKYIEHLLSRAIDGVIFVGLEHINEEYLYRLEASKIPFVLLDQARLNNGKEAQNINVPDEEGGKLVADYLFEMGQRKIGLIGPINSPSLNLKNRINGFIKRFMKLDDRNQVNMYDSPLNLQGGLEAAEAAILEQNTAIFALNDNIAVGVYRYCEMHHLTIPDDISVIGYDNIEVTSYISPPLTTVHQPAEIIGRNGALKLINSIDPQLITDVRQEVNLKLISRQSVKML